MPDKKKTWAERIQDIMGTATAPMKDLGENIQQGKPWFDHGPGPLEEAPRAYMQQAVNQINDKNPWSAPAASSLLGNDPFLPPGALTPSAPQAQPWSAPAASPPSRFDVQSFMGNDPFLPPGALMQPAPKETPSKLPHATPGPGGMFDSGAARPPAAFSTEEKNAQTQTTSAQPTVSTTGQQQPSNRYIDMLMAGPEAQREAEQHANIIETIRGTPGTSTGTHDRNAPSNTFGYFNPNNPRAREYSDKVGAITGMDRDVALGLHAINAPIQGQLAQEGIRQAGAKAAAQAAAQAGDFEVKLLDANPVTGAKPMIVTTDNNTGESTVKEIDTEGLDDGEMHEIETFAQEYRDWDRDKDPGKFSEEKLKTFWWNLTPQGRKIFAEILGFTGK